MSNYEDNCEVESMEIREGHLYHGAALNQIADHEQFTAINTLKLKGDESRSAFRVNDDIAVYLKYSTEPKGSFKEYKFTFTNSHLQELKNIAKTEDKLHLVLVCVKDRHICCIPYKLLLSMIRERRAEKGRKEEQYQLLVTLKKSEAFRVYMNQPSRRKIILGKPRKVRRNAFPNSLFK